MPSPIRSLCVAMPIIAASLFAGAPAFAQVIGPDETVLPDGAVTQPLALTPLQRSEIYDAVIARRGRSATPQIAAAIGQPVPPHVALQYLPAQAAAAGGGAALLKYAVVEDDVVLVDPLRMQVVDVIRGTLP
jgi:hypothetical protein